MKATIGNILKSKGAMAPALQPSNSENNRVSRANRRGRAHRNSDRMRTEELIRMIEEAEYSGTGGLVGQDVEYADTRPEEVKAEYRASRHCSVCGEKGHDKRNCPKVTGPMREHFEMMRDRIISMAPDSVSSLIDELREVKNGSTSAPVWTELMNRLGGDNIWVREYCAVEYMDETVWAVWLRNVIR